MKKQISKLKDRLQREKKALAVPKVTNDTLAKHRQAVIAKGRRYKYPMQQTKHRVVIISSILIVILLIATGFFTWWQLYKAQNISQFFYRVTQILPLPVANIDGEQAAYKEYLLELRSNLHYLTSKEAVNLSSDDGKRILDLQKRQAINKTLQNTYVRKLAREVNVAVTSQEVDRFIDNQIKSNKLGASRADFETVIRDYYDWSFDEYRQSIKNQLLKRKVVAAVDTKAQSKIEDIIKQLRSGADFTTLAKQVSDDESAAQNGGDAGFQPVSTQDSDGLIAAAANMEPNQISEAINGSTGVFVVKTLEKRDGQVRFARIFVRYTEFDTKFAQLREQNKIQEFIEIPEISTSIAAR